MECSTDYFIDMVASYSCLYNKKLKDFKNIIKKQEAWTEIGKICNMTADAAAKRFKSLREKYGREKRKNQLAERSGSGANLRYQWPYLNQLNFLDSFIECRSSSSNDNYEEFPISPIDETSTSIGSICSLTENNPPITLSHSALSSAIPQVFDSSTPPVSVPATPSVSVSSTPQLSSSAAPPVSDHATLSVSASSTQQETVIASPNLNHQRVARVDSRRNAQSAQVLMGTIKNRLDGLIDNLTKTNTPINPNAEFLAFLGSSLRDIPANRIRQVQRDIMDVVYRALEI